MSGLGHGRPIRLRDWYVRRYVSCGCAKTKGRPLRLRANPDYRHNLASKQNDRKTFYLAIGSPLRRIFTLTHRRGVLLMIVLTFS
jgi:hypothetical protein